MDESMSGWDRSVEMAWVRFQRRLGDFLADLEGDTTAVIHALLPSDPLDGTGPFIRFSAHDGGTMVRAEAASNRYLAPPYQLGDEQVAELVASGWAAPAEVGDASGRSPFFSVDLPRDRADLVALMSVRALRDAFAVPHPAFLQGGPLEAAPVVERAEPAPEPEMELLQILRPDSPEELDGYVEETLSAVLGREAFRDEDGDFPIRVGSVVLFVRPLQTEPVIEVFSPLVRDIGDRDQALLEVSFLNRDAQFISYHVGGTTIVARMHVPAFPFVPNHLAVLLSRMAETLDSVDDDLALRVGGRLWLDVEGAGLSGSPGAAGPLDGGDDLAAGLPHGLTGELAGRLGGEAADELTDDATDELVDQLEDELDEELPPELMALIQVDTDGAERQPPETVAGLFHGDMHLVLHSIRISEEQTIAWRESTADALAEGDEEEAAACAHEMRAWEKTVSDLRAALRFIVGRMSPGAWSS